MTDGARSLETDYTYEFRLTSQLEDGDLQGLCDLFEASFQKPMTPGRLREKFGTTCLGFSLHAILRHGQAGIVGSFNVMPETYRFFGGEETLGISVDTMVHPDHRRIPIHLKRMADLVEAEMKNRGIPFLFGFPNDNSFIYAQKIMKWKRIGDLPYLVLPMRPGAFVGALKPFDGLTSLFMRTLVRLLPLGQDVAVFKAPIERVNAPSPASYLARNDRQLVHLEGPAWMVYSIHEEPNGLKVAYLVDFSPVSRHVFHQALRHLAAVPTGADALAYVGTLPFKTHRLVQVPRKRIPKPLRLSGKVLLDTPGTERLLDFSQWHVNLATLDVR
jgi:hypothetical protein